MTTEKSNIEEGRRTDWTMRMSNSPNSLMPFVLMWLAIGIFLFGIGVGVMIS